MKPCRFFLALTLVAAVALESRAADPAPFAVTINSVTITPTPGVVGSTVQVVIGATGTIGALTYRVSFGDGTAPGFFTPNPTFTHKYALAGHYTLTIEVQESGVVSTTTRPLTVRNPLTTNKPTNSSTILHDAVNGRVWVVNPDQDTVATISTATDTVTAEIRVGKNPRTLAQAADGTIWVASQQHPSISIIEPVPPFALKHVIPLPHGSLPYGVCMTPDGTAAYVSFQGSGGVAKYSTSTRSLLATASSPPSARGIAVTSDGRVLVTRFISPVPNPLLTFSDPDFTSAAHGEVVELSASLAVVRTFTLALDPGIPGLDPDFGASVPPSASASRGQPNYLTSLVINPDGRRAWVPSKKDNIQRGTRTPERDGRTPGAEVTYRAIISSLNLSNNTAPTSERRDIDNSEMPQAACITPDGDYLFVALQGTNRVQAWDLYNMAVPLNSVGNLTGLGATDGLSPQGLVLNPATKKLYVQNYMGRTVSVIDATAILDCNGVPTALPAPSTVIATVLGADNLSASVLQGKRVFYNAGDPRMSLNGYISCAGCHLDGGSDMRVWDFTVRGEGFRNTVLLQGRAGTGHGNVHWSANFDEIQDFDNDVYFHFHANAAPPGPAGSSFTTNPNAPMSATNSGRDADLDALAAYVTSLNKVPRSPFRQADGSLTTQGAAGEATFKAKDCQRCHTGVNFTDSVVGNNPPVVDPVGPVAANTPILHDVGTLKFTSGKRLNGAPLPGVDTPTLKGVWETAPYFHDGSAATLADVFAVTGPAAVKHFGGPLTAQEQANLARYMLEIDEVDAPPVPAGATPDVSITSVSTNRPYSLATAAADALPFVDRSYQINTLSGNLNGNILLRTASDDRNVTTNNHVVLGLGSGVTTWRVYVCFDSRASGVPDWLTTGGWVVSAETIDLKNPALTMTVYEKDVPAAAGSVTLGGNKGTNSVGALRNYFVILRVMAGGPAVFEQGPLNQAEWVHPQDADGDGVRDDYEAVTAATLANLSPWSPNSVNAATADEDLTVPGGTLTLFEAQPPPISGGIVSAGGGSGGSGGGCGLSGLEFLLPLLGLRALRRRRRSAA